MTDLKTVLVEALNDSAFSVYVTAGRAGDCLVVRDEPLVGEPREIEFCANRLTQTIRDHFSTVHIVRRAETVYRVFHDADQAEAYRSAKALAEDSYQDRWLWNVNETDVEGFAGSKGAH